MHSDMMNGTDMKPSDRATRARQTTRGTHAWCRLSEVLEKATLISAVSIQDNGSPGELTRGGLREAPRGNVCVLHPPSRTLGRVYVLHGVSRVGFVSLTKVWKLCLR